jgi:hypothetical protein
MMKHSNQNVSIPTYFVYCVILVCSLYELNLKTDMDFQYKREFQLL